MRNNLFETHFIWTIGRTVDSSIPLIWPPKYFKSADDIFRKISAQEWGFAVEDPKGNFHPAEFNKHLTYRKITNEIDDAATWCKLLGLDAPP